MAQRATHVARLRRNGATHDIRPGWSYINIANARTKCGIPGPFPIESLNPSGLLTVTCKQCAKTD